MPLTACKICGAEIVRVTFELCGGTCMPCYKAAHDGLHPKAFARLEDRGLSDLHRRWKLFCEAARPRGAIEWDEGFVIEERLAGWISTFFSRGSMTPECRASMWIEVQKLKAQNSCVRGDAERYYCELEAIASEVLRALEQEPDPSTSCGAT